MEENKNREQADWSGYFEKTKDKQPRPLLIKAVSFMRVKEEALDLGSGAFNDIKFLLAEGFKHITAVDLDNEKAKEIYSQPSIPKDRVEYVISSFENFDFLENKFDIVNAQFSLPFNPPGTFNEVLNKIKDSLKEGGIFTGQFFGEKDEWNTEGSDKSFHTKEQVEKLLSDMEILEFEEKEEDGTTANGDPKHWHIFHFIVKKM